MIQDRIRPQEIRVLQNVAPAEEVDIVDSVLHTSRVVQVVNDVLQICDDVVTKDKIGVVDGTVQRCGGEAIIFGGVGESPELAAAIEASARGTKYSMVVK